MEEQLLQLALNSILHGSTQILSRQNGNGEIEQYEVKVGDLRLPLIEKIAQKLVLTSGFNDAILKAITPDVIKKLQDTILTKISYQDLPYSVRDRISDELKKTTTLEVRRFKVIAEVVDDNNK